MISNQDKFKLISCLQNGVIYAPPSIGTFINKINSIYSVL